MVRKALFPLSLILLLFNFMPLQAQTTLMGDFISSKEKVFGATVSAGGNVLIYLSAGKKKRAVELFEVVRSEDGKWGDPIKLSHISRDFDALIDPFISYDANYLFFSAKAKGGASYDIYYSERSGAVWQKPKPISGDVNSWKKEGSPSLSLDGKTLYFTREEFDYTGEGKNNLYQSEWVNVGSFSASKKVAAAFNEHDVQRPVLYRGGQTMLMSLKAPNGIGGYDIHYAQNQEGQWSKPQPLSFANTPKDDFLGGVPITLEQLYTVVDEQLYQVKIPEDLPVTPMVLVQGYVKDKKIGMHLPATMRLVDIEENQEVLVTQNNVNDGFYSLIAPAGKKYKLTFFAPNHVEADTLLDLSAITTYKKVKQNFALSSDIQVQFSLADVKDQRSTSGKINIYTGNQLVHSSFFEAGQQPEVVPLPLGNKYQFEVLANTCQPYRGIINFQHTKRYPEVFVKNIRMRRKIQELYFEILTPAGEKPKNTEIYLMNVESGKERTYSAVSLAYLEYGSRYKVLVKQHEKVINQMSLVVDSRGKIFQVSPKWKWGQPLKKQVIAPEGPKIEMKLSEI